MSGQQGGTIPFILMRSIYADLKKRAVKETWRIPSDPPLPHRIFNLQARPKCVPVSETFCIFNLRYGSCSFVGRISACSLLYEPINTQIFSQPGSWIVMAYFVQLLMEFRLAYWTQQGESRLEAGSKMYLTTGKVT